EATVVRPPGVGAEGIRVGVRAASRSLHVLGLTGGGEGVVDVGRPPGNANISAFRSGSHGSRAGTYKPSGSMRPRMLCARAALSWRPDNRAISVSQRLLTLRIIAAYSRSRRPR